VADVLARHLARAAEEFGTPVYVLDAASLVAAAQRLRTGFPDPWIRQYSLKANDVPEVVGLLAEHGRGANVVSSGEWRQAAAAGVAHHAVTFEGIGKTDAELAWAVRRAAAGEPVRWLALESPAEARALERIAGEAGLGAAGIPALDVLLRVNPQVSPETLPGLAVGAGSSKFGMDVDEILSLVRAGLDGGPLRVRGIHVHVGSDLGDVAAWADAGACAVRLLRDIAPYVEQGDTVDFGGGFPLDRVDGPTPQDFHDALLERLDSAGLDLPPRRAVEPGRYLVGAAGWLVGRVLHSRPRAPHAQQVVLDTGMTELIRPALYGSHHPVVALDHRPSAGGLRETAVEGPVCESTDSFGLHRLPALERGDLVAVGQAGAYAASFTSRYNGRPHPAEVVLWPDGSLQPCRRVDVQRHDARLALTGQPEPA
jgi:diaminopimelate decarboxylase